MPPFPTTEPSYPPGKQPLLMTCPRLRGWEAMIVVALLGLFWILVPRLVVWLNPPEFPTHYRTPYAASEDYWRYQQFVRQVVEHDQVLLVGDSVIWGEYVPADATLSAALNARIGSDRFANGGVNGLHPLAMLGLMRHYGHPLTSRAVVLHCNLLWMTSAERDLSVEGDEGGSFNHPRLIPQFQRSLRSYQADSADRLSVWVEQRVAMRQWVRHLWVTYLGGQDLPGWTLEHPYAWPNNQLLGVSNYDSRQSSDNWRQRAIPRQAYDWVELASSQQWAAFRKTIENLQAKGNRVFVLVGPFNAHLLTDENRQQWQQLREAVVAQLSADQVHFAAPDVLPSDDYADASHPLSNGYQLLAETLWNDASFRQWLDHD